MQSLRINIKMENKGERGKWIRRDTDFLEVGDARVDKKPDGLDKADSVSLSCLGFTAGEMLNQWEEEGAGLRGLCEKGFSKMGLGNDVVSYF